MRCSDAVSLWFHQNALLLNPSKTEAILFATRQRLVGVDFSHTIKVAGADIQFSEAVKLLGVTLDTSLSFDQHVTKVVCACNFHLGRCDICGHRSPLSWQNRWQLPLSLLGSIIATASCTALRSETSTVSRRYRTRRLASCIRLPSRRVPRLCANSCTGYRSDNGSYTSWRPLLSRQSTVRPHRIFTNSFETTRLPGHFNLLLLHCFTDHLCPPSSPVGCSTTLHLKFRTVSGHP